MSKHYIGKVYDLTQANFQKVIKELEELQAKKSPVKKEALVLAVQELESFAGQLRMSEDGSQVEDGVFIQDTIPEFYDIIERNLL